MSIITNPCDHVIDDDDDYIVPVMGKRQRILSTSEDSDSDLSHQCEQFTNCRRRFYLT